MASHAPDLPERSNPLVWTIGLVAIVVILVSWFSHWFGTGRTHGRGLVIPVEKPAEAPVDHAKLIADRSEAVLDRGQIIYSKTCGTCHGPTGQENPTGLTPPPRNFHKDAFMNPNGGGPYGLYTVLENGFNGRMPAQPGLSPADKYAVIHFVRETFVKKDNAANYLADDKADVKAKIPKPGEGAGAGPEIPPPRRPVAAPVRPLIAAIAADADADAAASTAWIKAAASDAKLPVDVARAVRGLADQRGSGSLVALYRLAKANDAAGMRTLLGRGDTGLYQPGIIGMGDAQFQSLVTYLASQAASSAQPAPKGAK